MSSSNKQKHKGNRGDAYLVFLGIEIDEDFNPAELNSELFNEQNFLIEELQYIARKAKCFTGASIVCGHPNADITVKAICAKLLLEGINEIGDIEL